MGTLLIVLGIGAVLLLAYHTHGRWLARRFFPIDPKAGMPSIELNDDRDYVSAAKSIALGHHFTSISGDGGLGGVSCGWSGSAACLTPRPPPRRRRDE